MKKLMLAIVTMIFASQVHAKAAAGTNSVSPQLGMSQSALNFGVNYEHRNDPEYGVGGYFFFSSEKKDSAGKNQVMTFGAMLPIHLMDNNAIDLSIAPGFGIAMVKGISPQDDQTCFGPSMKIGAQYKFAGNVKAGIERFYVANWSSDKVVPSVEYTSAIMTFDF